MCSLTFIVLALMLMIQMHEACVGDAPPSTCHVQRGACEPERKPLRRRRVREPVRVEAAMASLSRRELLRPASATAILALDWLSWLLGTFYELELFAPAAVWSAAFAGLCVWLVEGLGSDPRPALAKGALAAAIVWVPGLILGTIVGLLALTWWGAGRLAERRERRR
jgi:hypothetical protein